MSARDEAAGGVDTLCECLTCGRMHRYLARPPWALSHEDLCRLSRVFGERANLTINTQDYRINEWLKLQITKAANPSSPSPRDQASSAMLGALESVALRPARYNGNTIEIEADSHWDGIQRMLDARKAIDLARSAGIEPLAHPVEGKVMT